MWHREVRYTDAKLQRNLRPSKRSSEAFVTTYQYQRCHISGDNGYKSASLRKTVLWKEKLHGPGKSVYQGRNLPRSNTLVGKAVLILTDGVLLCLITLHVQEQLDQYNYLSISKWVLSSHFTTLQPKRSSCENFTIRKRNVVDICFS